MWTWKEEKKSNRSPAPITKSRSLCPKVQPEMESCFCLCVCVCVCVSLNITPPRRWHSCKTSSKMPLSASHQRDEPLRLCETSGFGGFVSSSPDCFDARRSQESPQNCFSLCERKHTSREQKSYSKSTKSTWGHSVSQIGSSCCCHITDNRNKWGCSVPNVQTCEFNQVHRRLWLETHAAFLSYDSITRLFSSTVKGGRPSPDCTLSSVTLFFFGGGQGLISHLMCSIWMWILWVFLGGTGDGADRFLMQPCACEDFSMGTAYKPNYCSQQMEAWGWGWRGGDDFQMLK